MEKRENWLAALSDWSSYCGLNLDFEEGPTTRSLEQSYKDDNRAKQLWGRVEEAWKNSQASYNRQVRVWQEIEMIKNENPQIFGQKFEKAWEALSLQKTESVDLQRNADEITWLKVKRLKIIHSGAA